jgi:hypothetical protein
MPGLTITIPVAHMPPEADPRTWVVEHARSIAEEKGFEVRGKPTVTRRRTGGLPLDWDEDEFVVTWKSAHRKLDTAI